MISESVVCDVCGTQKGTVNHWWVIWKPTTNGLLQLEPWGTTAANANGATHICGQACAHKALDKFMQDATTPQPTATDMELDCYLTAITERKE